MKRIVVDASVVVKWYVLEDDRSRALKIREDYIDGLVELAAPALMPFEVLNIIRCSSDGLGYGKLAEIAESLSLYGFELHHLEGEYARLTASIALENGITVYDASYVVLAKVLDTVLYTADERLLGKLKSDYGSVVRLLADYPTR